MKKMLGGMACLLLAGGVCAQVQKIPAGGISGLTEDELTFEPEYRERAKAQAGVAVPAPPGTRPGSTDPRNLNGIWINGKTFPLGKAAQKQAPAFGGGPRSAGGGLRAVRQECVPRPSVTVGLPGLIVQTPKVIYILRNGQDGSSYRRIRMNARHVSPVVPNYTGDSVGHWEGNTLVIDTVGLKGAMSAGDFGGAVGHDYTPQSRVVERIRKIEGGLKLENLITISDPELAEPYQARTLSYWRPDLKVVEAPCEEYSDPLETEDTGPFQGGDEGQPGAPP